MRIWHLGWEGDNSNLIVCDQRKCNGFEPSYVRPDADGNSMHGWVYMPDYDTPPGVHEAGPTVHAWFDPGNSYIRQSTLQLTESVSLEVPEPSQSHMYAAALLTVAVIHRWARRTERGSR